VVKPDCTATVSQYRSWFENLTKNVIARSRMLLTYPFGLSVVEAHRVNYDTASERGGTINGSAAT